MKFSTTLLFFLYAVSLFSQSFYRAGIQEIRLEIPAKDWDTQLDMLKNNDPDARMAATAFVNGVRFDSVGVRYKGNSSYFRTRKETYKKLPFNIKLNHRIKSQYLEGTYTNLKLSNGFLDPSFVRDPLAYEVVRQYMPAPECNFTRLYINGAFWGLYINAESIDGKFLKKHFKSNDGCLVKCDPDDWKKTRSADGCAKGANASLVYLGDNPACYFAFYEVDEEYGWPLLMRLIKTLNQKPEEIESVLDVDQTLWMLALNNVLVNLDSYNGSLSHNYYVCFDSTGVAHPLIWDLNLAFGGWRRDQNFRKMSDEELIRFHPLADISNPQRPLISQLLKNPLYRKIYLAHYRTIVREQLETGVILQRAEVLQREIDPWVQKDSLKLYPYEAFKSSMTNTWTAGPDQVIGIRQLMEPRTKWLKSLDVLQATGPVIGEPTLVAVDSSVTVRVTVGEARSVWLCYRSAPAFSFKRLQMNAEDGALYTATLPAGSIRHYYLLAEGADAATTLPEKASFAYRTFDPVSN